MTRTLLGLLAVAVTVGATTAQADDFRGRRGHRAVPVAHDCGPRPTRAPHGTTFSHGQYQLQATQRWVPGQQQQVWVAGTCRGRFNQRCTPGHYRWVTTPGHYETAQQWVWVPATQYAPQQYSGYAGSTYGAYDAYGAAHGQAGVHVQFSAF